MYQKFTTTRAIANRGSAMETGDHSKNGVSPKNQRSRRNFLIFGVLALGLSVLTLNSCKTYEGIQLKGDAVGFSDNIETSYKKKKNGKPMPKSEPYLLVGDVKYRDGNLLEYEGHKPKAEPKEGLATMSAFIHDLEQGENTALYYATDKGLDRVKDVQKKYMHKSKKSKYYVIAFTDGLDNISNTKKLGNISGSESKWHKKYNDKLQKKMKNFGKKNHFQSFVLVLWGDDLKKSGYSQDNMKTELIKFTSRESKDDVIVDENTESLKKKFIESFENKSFNFEIPKGYLEKQVQMKLRNKEGDLVSFEGKLEKKGSKYYLTNVKTTNGITFENQGKKNIKQNRIEMSKASDRNSTKILFEIRGLSKQNKPFTVLPNSKNCGENRSEQCGSEQWVSKEEITKKKTIPADGWRFNSEYVPTPTTITDGYILGIIDCSRSMQDEYDDKGNKIGNKMVEAKQMMIDIIKEISKTGE